MYALRLFLLFIIFAVALIQAKVFQKCELVNTLRSYGADSVDKWVCIAYHESNYDTNALNPSTGDHGIFQISQIYWCSTGGSPGGGCNIRCDQLHDDDIRDDFQCANLIKGQSGFQAWVTYPLYCAGDTSEFVAGC